MNRLGKLMEIAELYDNEYLYEVDWELLDEMLSRMYILSVGDRYAYYYTAEEWAASMSSSAGDSVGIGVYVVPLESGEIEIAHVMSGSPAEKAGVQVADIVVEVDGTRVSSMEEMTAILQSKQAGDTATLKVYRVEGGLDSYEDQTSIPDGEYIDLTVELAMLDAAAQ